MNQRPIVLQNFVVIWASLLFAQVAFIGVLTIIAPQQGPVEPVMPILLAVAGVPAALASLLLPKNLFRAALQKKNPAMEEVADPNALPGFGKTLRVPKDPQGLLRAMLPEYGKAVIIGCALAESVSLLGFVLKFLGFGWPVAAPFFAVGLALTALQFPSQARLEAYVEAALGVPLGRS